MALVNSALGLERRGDDIKVVIDLAPMERPIATGCEPERLQRLDLINPPRVGGHAPARCAPVGQIAAKITAGPRNRAAMTRPRRRALGRLSDQACAHDPGFRVRTERVARLSSPVRLHATVFSSIARSGSQPGLAGRDQR